MDEQDIAMFEQDLDLFFDILEKKPIEDQNTFWDKMKREERFKGANS